MKHNVCKSPINGPLGGPLFTFEERHQTTLHLDLAF